MAEFEALEALKERMAAISGLGHAGSLLTWDQETYMPEGGTGRRAGASATVSRLAHEWGTSEEYGRLLERAEAEVSAAGLPDEGDEGRLLWRARRDYEQKVKVPADLVAEMQETEVRAVQAWQAARKADDWPRFASHLETILGLQRQMADHLGYEDHPYDALLDLFEPEMRTADVRAVFAQLREETAPLVKAVGERADAVDDSFLHAHYDEDAQWALALDVTKRFGYDYERGRMDRSAHPFTMYLGRDDARITVRVDPDFFNTCFYAAVHECGHALYGQGIPAEYEGTSLFGAASSGLNESQSRLMENVVARGRDFLGSYYGYIQECFPERLSGVDVDRFYRAVNRSGPSLIRVEADELTYNLHIMLRFDLEVALIEGSLDVRDLPQRWNDTFEEYVGIRPPNDADGVLQDIHWSSGLFGYFPTYSLGNVMSVQFYEAALRSDPRIDESLQRGEPGPLVDWMRRNIYEHGRKYPPQEVLERATGQRLTAGPYVDYLRRKYGEIYGV